MNKLIKQAKDSGDLMEEQIRVKMVLPKIPDIELMAIESIDQMAHYLGVSTHKIKEAHIMTMEAVINAFEHGSAQQGKIHLDFIMSRRKLIILIRDRGKGFKPELVEDPEISKKIGRPNKRGWGLKLMKALSDEFNISSDDKGTKIKLVKNLC